MTGANPARASRRCGVTVVEQPLERGAECHRLPLGHHQAGRLVTHSFWNASDIRRNTRSGMLMMESSHRARD